MSTPADETRQSYSGSCQCGQVRFQVTGKPLTLFCCHCTECRKQSGSAFGMAFWLAEAQLELQGATPLTWSRLTSSGQTISCDFCPHCGSRLLHRASRNPLVLSIKPGTLDNPPCLTPAGHIWTRSAWPWAVPESGCLLYPENPPSFDEMLAVRRNWDSVD